MTKKKVILSGTTPSSRLTLGNYVGAIRNWAKLQTEYDCLYMVADMHAITVRQDPKLLREQTRLAAANYIAAGLDPKGVTLFVQSHVPEHAMLSWVLTCFSYMGELSRMTQFKDKSSKEGANIGAGLFAYPALMAADILLYQSHLVPVGEDQKQHLELTRDLAIRMNNAYPGERPLFVVPDPFIPTVGAKIMSLQNPTAKMSKSDPDPNATVFLIDTDDQITKKLKRAVTDSGSEVTFEDSKPGVKNLITIQAALTGRKPEEIVASYAGKQYGHLKIDTAELVIQTVRPIREETQRILADPGYLDGILKKGAEAARERAARTVSDVFERVGIGI